MPATSLNGVCFARRSSRGRAGSPSKSKMSHWPSLRSTCPRWRSPGWRIRAPPGSAGAQVRIRCSRSGLRASISGTEPRATRTVSPSSRSRFSLQRTRSSRMIDSGAKAGSDGSEASAACISPTRVPSSRISSSGSVPLRKAPSRYDHPSESTRTNRCATAAVAFTAPSRAMPPRSGGVAVNPRRARNAPISSSGFTPGSSLRMSFTITLSSKTMDVLLCSADSLRTLGDGVSCPRSEPPASKRKPCKAPAAVAMRRFSRTMPRSARAASSSSPSTMPGTPVQGFKASAYRSGGRPSRYETSTVARTRPGEICARSTSRTEAIAAPFPPNQRCCGSHPARSDMSMGSISFPIVSSEVVVEPLLALAEAEQRPDGGGFLQREPHLRCGALPEGSFVAEQLVHLVGLLRVDPQIVQREIEDRLLRRVRIEADCAKQDVRAVGRRFRVEEDPIVVRLVEPQIPVELQGRILLAHPVERRDPVLDVALLVAVPVDELVLLGVQVLLLARDGLVLSELEPRVHAPRRRQRRRQRRAQEEGGPASFLQMLGKDVGRVRPEVPDHVIRGRTLGELLQVILHLVLEIAPGEIGIRLVEPDLGERLHHLRAGEGFREEDHVGVASVHFADHPLPEGNRLRVRIIDAEDVHAGVDPVQEDRTQLRPERFARRSQPVEIDDVLVALGRVLRRLDGPVRPPVEPFRMLLHVRMIRRALEGDVEGDLY